MFCGIRLAGQFGRQRFGGDHIAAGRQHLAAELRVEIVQVGVAGQHQGGGPHLALGGVYADLGAVVDAGDRRVFKQLHAQAGGGGRFAEGQVERVQMTRAHVDHAADILVGADHAGHVLGRDHAQLVLVAEAAQFGGIFGKLLVIAGLVGQVAVAPGQVAVDLVLATRRRTISTASRPISFKFAHAVLADHRCELLEAMADAANQLSAIAPAGAPANQMGFQEHHREAALGQLDGGVQAGKTATDDAHIGTQFTAQGRVARVRVGAGGVIRGGVLRAVYGLVGGHGAILLIIVVRMLALGRSIGGR